MDLTPAVAYLSDGKLYLKDPRNPPRQVESAFAQGLVDRAARGRQRNDWKAKGAWWNLNSARMIADASSGAADVRRIRITGVTRGGPDGQLLYALDTDTVGGLFEYGPGQDHERRLFHRNRFRARDLSRHPADGALAFSVAQDDGSANLAVMESEGKGPREVTEGDSVDEAPSWSAAAAGAGRALVFQSAGIGRNPAGLRIALGPYSVQRLDLNTGDLTVLLEDDETDYLVPREAADGTLYYIRRPHRPDVRAPSPLKVIADVVLFPFRLAVAILHFLNFFSMVFSRKPLITAGGTPKEGPDTRSMMLWGKVIDAEKALRESQKSGGGKALVPKSWELVRRSPDGAEWVAARGVVSFDLCSNGSLVYTDGSSVYHLPPDGKPTPLCEGTLIERVTLA